MATIINASTSNGLIQSADTSGTLQLQSAGTTKFTVDSTGAYGQLQSATAQASTSGTSIDFTGIPSWVKRITVMFTGVSVAASTNPLIQIGSGSFTTTGYLGSSTNCTAGTTVTSNFTAGFGIRNTTGAGALYNGCVSINLLTTNTWSAFGVLSQSDTTVTTMTAGSVVIGGTLDRVRITTSTGTDTFDAGTINIMYEG
jgi:hypothetical protein